MSFKDIKGTPPKVTGTTVINHELRLKLGLGPASYIMMEHVYNCAKNNKPLEVTDTYIKTGFSGSEQSQLILILIQQGFVFPVETTVPQITDKWESAFPDFEKEFHHFWTEELEPGSNKRKNAWKGAPKPSLDKYKAIRKKYSAEFLLNQRNDYFEFLRLQKKYRNFDRARMGCLVFLGPKEAYIEDWKSYIDELKEEFEPKEKPKEDVKPMTSEDLTDLHK